ncbi:prothymosin alpha-like [Meriones unguiculatus]|uniref:prothymosin alpha-like n=1 Tax=Meriones unguiculatus TaxID=10047 RepID=UPI000B4F1CD9|nr:prothymosin alpha-like [Meriones unguiculatus]
MSDAAVDNSSEITTKDLKEKKEAVEEAENGRDAPANGNANEENGKQEADNEVEEEEEEGGEEEEEEEEGDGEDGDEDEETEFRRGHLPAEKQAPPHSGQCHPQMTCALHHPTKTTT